MLAGIIKQLSKSVDGLNHSMLSIFRTTGDRFCETSFKAAFTVTGAIGRLLKQEKTAANICKQTTKGEN
ncbi:unnamed protein product [Caenorhabditis nigoni]